MSPRLFPVLTLLLGLGAIVALPTEAHANINSARAAFQDAHARAAASTQVAGQYWSAYPRLRQQFDAAMRSSDARTRETAKNVAVRWLAEAQRLLIVAQNDHASAVRAMDQYLRYAGRNPEAEALRARLVEAQYGIAAHVREIDNLRRWVITL